MAPTSPIEIGMGVQLNHVERMSQSLRGCAVTPDENSCLT
jgi:hypothetical protein